MGLIVGYEVFGLLEFHVRDDKTQAHGLMFGVLLATLLSWFACKKGYEGIPSGVDIVLRLKLDTSAERGDFNGRYVLLVLVHGDDF